MDRSADAARIAVDIGGTTIKLMAFDGTGTVIDRRIVATRIGREPVLTGLSRTLADVRERTEAAGRALDGVGIGSPGIVHPSDGVVAFAANLDWRDLPLARLIEDQLDVPVRVENDGRAGALAERALADPGDAGSLAFVPIGTGVSAAFFSHGALHGGTTGAAGELGHIRAVRDGEACPCGGRGCVEVYASASGIARRYERSTGTPATSAEVIAAVGDDESAQRVWRDAISALAIGVAALISITDPTRVVIGGGLSLAGDRLIAPLREAVAEELPWRSVPVIVSSTLGSSSGLVGAALLDAASDAEARERADRLGAALRMAD
ncbi:ROK family protein [Herbiconiux sp. L3-i23]|uniref:ROK family protein n=1 Tax=Herbiconiux sp. L3-i23 TaxID=2905871 RepID=UPI0020499B69|nr:ROK family protein [Herbiconiux sp. L3-i23]BDI23332.1 sugar kinase [Herbiconiux sp. L3-i23]